MDKVVSPDARLGVPGIISMTLERKRSPLSKAKEPAAVRRQGTLRMISEYNNDDIKEALKSPKMPSPPKRKAEQ